MLVATPYVHMEDTTPDAPAYFLAIGFPNFGSFFVKVSKSSVQSSVSGNEMSSRVANRYCCVFAEYLSEVVRFRAEFFLNANLHSPVKGWRLTPSTSYSPTT